ncbi:MAG: bifunctional adenosylcobinamide kinase/adenosylcobinamide-phosphate guanylyltransferase [Phyllobacteriaceae bacterium]|nr:bifunctional adenosylcobinamide kinase/adenosylcobinamide-phosphate guanylyltransferase [Phyllobacteriaceae bacterium]
MDLLVASPRLDFVLGGARSGKTSVALARAETSGLKPVMVATAQAFDAEMEARIAAHRAERGPAWGVIEEPLDLAGVIARETRGERILVVDCLTVWLSNLLFAERDADREIDGLVATAVAAAAGPVVFVSNEVGLGIVPENALARRFRDLQGRLNREVARIADRVTLVVAGLEVAVKAPIVPSR